VETPVVVSPKPVNLGSLHKKKQSEYEFGTQRKNPNLSIIRISNNKKGIISLKNN
jgi:hypothetical protein